MNTWQTDVKFENGVYRFDLPNGDEFVIVPKQLDLTEKEIDEILQDENIAELHGNDWLIAPYPFAKAILRKAQEK